ncbi:MAG: putative short-chain dehydrogenase [Mycobacterium sp.]|nr:putative short-chain dehydrogenase [Mycobacterium sp.]
MEPVSTFAAAFDLADKHAWVTGAGGGIGRACALLLAELGACVHLVGRTEETLAGTQDAISALERSSSIHVGDVTDTAFVNRMFDSHDVDVLVNSAGVNIPQPIADVTPESFATVLGVNLTAAFFVTQAAVASMRHHGRGGSIVSISSQMGHVGGPERAAYCASKWGLEGLTKAMALELAPEGIRMNTVAATFVDTDLAARSFAKPGFRDWVMSKIPAGRLLSVEEVAFAVAFLAAPASGLTTGSSLVTDGGWTAQ